jgi:hypothetical protein
MMLSNPVKQQRHRSNNPVFQTMMITRNAPALPQLKQLTRETDGGGQKAQVKGASCNFFTDVWIWIWMY